jgi:GT2 family glycosyltransferase
MVCIVILNWNRWRDTVECLESLFRLDYADFQVVLCDNDSIDGSVEQIQAWADGKLPDVQADHRLQDLTSPPVPKPIRYSEYGYDEIGRMTDATNEDVPLILIRTGANRGFAGGNNVGLRYAMKRRDVEFVWLLNNDTVVCKDALTRMVETRSSRSEGADSTNGWESPVTSEHTQRHRPRWISPMSFGRWPT